MDSPEDADPTAITQKFLRLVESSRRQAETIVRLEQKILMAEQAIRIAEEALGAEQAMRDEFEQKNIKKSETIKALESFRAEIEVEVKSLREQLKEANTEKSSLSSNFNKFTESAKSEIQGLKIKLEEFAKKTHMNDLERMHEKITFDQTVADLNMKLKIREEEVQIYKSQLSKISPDVYIAKATSLDQQLARLHAERSEEKAALATLLTDIKTKLEAALIATETEKSKRLDAELRLQELLKENAFLINSTRSSTRT